jgi:hypothetical protein
MPDQARVVVTNTTPLIALTAATGNLDVLRTLRMCRIAGIG